MTYFRIFPCSTDFMEMVQKLEFECLISMNIIQQRVNGVERVWPGMIWATHVSPLFISWFFRALRISQNLLLGLLDTHSSHFSALTHLRLSSGGESPLLCASRPERLLLLRYKAKRSTMNDAAHSVSYDPGISWHRFQIL